MKQLKQLTIRGINSKTKVRLEEMARKEGVSLNKFVQEQLNELAAGKHKPSFSEYFATQRFVLDDNFENSLNEQRVIESELWRD